MDSIVFREKAPVTNKLLLQQREETFHKAMRYKEAEFKMTQKLE
jgi:hypothetical protein